MLNMTLNILSVSPTKGGVSTFTAFAIIYFIIMLGFMYFMNPNKGFKQQLSSNKKLQGEMNVIVS